MCLKKEGLFCMMRYRKMTQPQFYCLLVILHFCEMVCLNIAKSDKQRISKCCRKEHSKRLLSGNISGGYLFSPPGVPALGDSHQGGRLSPSCCIFWPPHLCRLRAELSCDIVFNELLGCCRRQCWAQLGPVIHSFSH